MPGVKSRYRPWASAALIVDAVSEARPGRRAAYFPRLEEAAGYVSAQLRAGDLVLSMGAGDITTLPQRIIDTERADREPA